MSIPLRSRFPPRFFAPLWAMTLVCLFATSARAGDKAAAESLFNAGKDLMEQERYEEACEKFAGSMDAEPSVGAQLNLALCHEKRGEIATAWSLYRDAAVMAGALDDSRRQRGAEALAEALEPKISKLTVHVTHRPDGLRVTRDGTVIAAFDTELPVDPGTYVIEANAPGHEPWSTEVTVGPEAARERVTIPRLEPRAGADAPASEGQARPDWQVIAGWSAVGVGALGLTIGTVFGVLATSDANALESNCGEDRTCPDDQLDELDTAKTRANVATGTLIVGGLFAAGGAVLLLIDPIELGDSAEARLMPSVGPAGGGLTVTGRF